MATHDAALLAALGGGAWVSGADLARARGISRAAVSKQVAALRRQGFTIEAAPRRGYRLVGAPDRPLPALLQPLLQTRRFGRELRALERVGSTNDEAAAWARAGAPEGALVLAETQEHGRGRVGRRWHSPPGENLYLSLVLRPPRPPHELPPLTLAAGLAVFDVCAARGLRPELKWPNDVLLGGKKVAGVLTEMSSEAERVLHVVIGLGLNVNGTKFPAELRERATSLRLASGPGAPPLGRAALLCDLLLRLEARYHEFLDRGPAAVVAAFRERWAGRGRAVRVQAGDAVLRGVAQDVDDGGALLVARGGAIERVLSGEVLRWD
ncbi:MAG: biotin--[acetyl-CoA-carboxylase] ligase [Deltaproteobacteria bacterium]|nr:biotin--[acetyl-CoA-carboxylase] ligase [Deltaproteobacteria bacterium]